MAKPIVAYGDSNTVGHGLPGYVTNVPAADAYITVLASTLGVSKDVRAKSGNMMADQSWSGIYGTVPSASNHYTVLLGTNDSQHYGNSPVKREAAINFLRNILVWNLCPVKTLARDAGMTFTGSWSNTPVNSIGRTTTAADAEAQATVAGTNVYVSYILQNATGSEATFDIIVDDILAKTVVCNGTAVGSSLLGQAYAGACVEVAGLDPGPHIVRVVNKVSGKSLFLEYIAGSEQPERPHAFVCDIPYRTTAGYGGGTNNDANIDAYNADIAALLAELAVASHKVHRVTIPDFNTATHYQSDGIHFNVAGHAVFAGDFLASISAVDSELQYQAAVPIGALRQLAFVGNPVLSTTYH